MGAQACCQERQTCCMEETVAWRYLANVGQVVPRLPARCAEPEAPQPDSDSGDDSEAEVALEWAQAPKRLPWNGMRGPRSLFEATPDIEVVNVGARTATVQWRTLPGRGRSGGWSCCIRVFRSTCSAQSAAAFDAAEAVEIATFQVDGQKGFCELPVGALERASGPYRVQMVAKPAQSAWKTGRSCPPITCHFLSAAFFTVAEAPAAVEDLRITDVGRLSEQREVHVEWAEPLDDGGAPVTEYEVCLTVPVAPGQPGVFEWRSVRHEPGGRAKAVFASLAPGTGQVEAEVRARSAVGLVGATASLQGPAGPASSPGGATPRASPRGVAGAAPDRREPAAPERLEAWLLPEGPESTPRLGSAIDAGFVRLEFSVPLAEGEGQVESYHIFGAARGVAAEGLAGPAAEPGLLGIVPASEAARSSDADAGCACAYTVAVLPNCAYAFSVAASDGVRLGRPSAPTGWVDVPARGPLAPREAPESLRTSNTSAELLFSAPRASGGLPITAFKVGVIGMGLSSGWCKSSWDVQREVAVPIDEVLVAEAPDSGGAAELCLAAALDCPGLEAVRRSVVPLWEEAARREVTFKARIGELEAGCSYRFVVAACTAAGTSPWSPPSVPTRTQAYLDVVQGECKVPTWVQERLVDQLHPGDFGLLELAHTYEAHAWVELGGEGDFFKADTGALSPLPAAFGEDSVMSPIGKGEPTGLLPDMDLSPCAWMVHGHREHGSGSKSFSGSGGSTADASSAALSPSVWTPESVAESRRAWTPSGRERSLAHAEEETDEQADGEEAAGVCQAADVLEPPEDEWMEPEAYHALSPPLEGFGLGCGAQRAPAHAGLRERGPGEAPPLEERIGRSTDKAAGMQAHAPAMDAVYQL